jgi:cytosine/adenosine deaminase-related metal-dependent hydrolase
VVDTPSRVALIFATKNAYAGLGIAGKAGEIKVGTAADLTLWDLTSLAMLPRTDPVAKVLKHCRSGSATTIGPPSSVVAEEGVEKIDCTERMLLCNSLPLFLLKYGIFFYRE